jgi:hypothetical protein
VVLLRKRVQQRWGGRVINEARRRGRGPRSRRAPARSA